MRFSNFKKIISFFASVLLVFSSVAYATNIDDFKKKGQSIIVDGDKVEYFEEDGKIVAEGNVSIEYGKVILSCDLIEVNTKTRRALCEGNVRIESPDGVLTGERIRYDFNAEEGQIVGGDVKAYPWFGQADNVAREGENKFILKNGHISTCDHDTPHYRLQAKHIEVYPDEKVIAKNVAVYIGKVPVMWFPYYYHPIISTKAKVQFIPGVTSDWGYFLLSAWRMQIKGNTKADILIDYRTKKGFAGGANIYYDMNDFGLAGLGKGVLKLYNVWQNGWGTYQPTPYRDETSDYELRERYQLKHRIDFEPGTVGMIEFNKVSDENVLRDYFYNEFEEEGRRPPNYLSIVSAKRNYTFSFTMDRRFNDFYTVAQRLPEFRLDIPNQRLWETPFYYTSYDTAINWDKQYKDEQSPPEKVGRLDSYHKLSYVTGVGPLNVTPYADFQATGYTRTKWEHDPVGRVAFGAGVDTFIRFHRSYDFSTKALGLDINGLRHIVVPTANFYHRHQPTVDKDNLYQMDSVDELEKENGFALALETKLQTKRGGDDGEKDVIDFVRFITRVNYDFRMEKDRFKFEKEGKFKDLTFDLEVSPNDRLFFDCELEVLPKNQSVNTGSIEVSYIPNDIFSLAAGYRYEKLAPESRNQLTLDLDYILNEKWKLGVYQRLDFQDLGIDEQQYTITRDLHCWEVELAYSLRGSNPVKDDWTLWLAFKIKAFPDLQLGLSRSFNKRPPGSLRTQSAATPQ